MKINYAGEQYSSRDRADTGHDHRSVGGGLLGRAKMERFVHDANIAHYRKLIFESELDPSRDENRHKMLLRLFAEEKAKDFKPLDG
jgi:hypothetical protein